MFLATGEFIYSWSEQSEDMTSQGSKDAEGTMFGLLRHRWKRGGASEGCSGAGLPLFSIDGAHSWFFRASFMLMSAFHAPILIILWQCVNREDPCYLMVESKQRRADERSSATPTLSGSSLPVAQEASISGCAEVFKTVGRPDGRNAWLNKTRRRNLIRHALGLLVKTKVQLL